jgi:hypothetical protein
MMELEPKTLSILSGLERSRLTPMRASWSQGSLGQRNRNESDGSGRKGETETS